MFNEPMDQLLVILSGLGEVRCFQRDAVEEVLQLLGRDYCIGLACLVESEACWWDVVTLTDSQVVRLSCDSLQDLLQQVPELVMSCIPIQNDHLQALRQRVIDRRLNGSQRLLMTLQELAQKNSPWQEQTEEGLIAPMLAQADLAAITGMARETVSRTLSRLRERGEICKLPNGWKLATSANGHASRPNVSSLNRPAKPGR